MIKVCKFGGTSMADASAMLKAKEIVDSDDARRYIVVSAPGQRFKGDVKITDVLYKCYNETVKTGACKENFAVIRERFTGIVKDLKLDFDISPILDETEKAINEQASEEYAASRGEYLSAIVFAKLLGAEFVDAADMIRFDSTGKLNEEYTDDKVKTRLKGVKFAVIPGFYGKDSFGKIKTFSRGGSDITGSIIARGIKADLYENWTDVSGFLICDPRIVPESGVIKQLTYIDMRPHAFACDRMRSYASA